MKLKPRPVKLKSYEKLFASIKEKRLDALARAVREARGRWDWDSEMPVRLSD